MRITSLTFATLASTAAAQTDIAALLASLGPASDSDPRFTDWTPPGAGDVRSPCPGLNTLANHGFIHHNGKNMTIPHLLVGLAEGMNMGADFTIAIGGAGLLSSPDPEGGAFDLNDLDQHNFPIEHDASLSRMDAYFGNDYSFNNATWQQVLSYYEGRTYTDINSSADARYGRYTNSKIRNPTFTFGFREFVLAYGESALYLQTMSNPLSNGVARIDWIREMFEKEKLPYDLGWRPSAEPITLTSLGEQVFQLFSAGPEPFTEGEEITTSSYKDIFELLFGGSEIFANLTDGYSSAIGL